MVTKVGTQSDFAAALKDLLELDYDAIEAYEAAINRLEDAEYKSKLTGFKEDHQRHTREITALLQAHGEEAPTGPSSKQWLTKGKVVLAQIVGDGGILAAMQTNEVDTNTAYQRMNEHEHKWLDATDLLSRGLKDEKRHKAWLESIIQS